MIVLQLIIFSKVQIEATGYESYSLKYVREIPELLDSFHAKSDKNQKMFYCMLVSKFQKTLGLKICNGACIISKVAACNFDPLHFLKQ